jgi:hypothetical protein
VTKGGSGPAVVEAVDAWVAAFGPTARRASEARAVVLTACGGAAVVDPDVLSHAELLLAARTRALTEALADGVVDPDCAATGVMRDAEYAAELRAGSEARTGGLLPPLRDALARARSQCTRP